MLRTPRLSSCARNGAAFILSIALGALGAAQVTLTGSISDDTSGPLLSGTVYHANGSLTVPAGKTLTVNAGAIVKFTSAYLDVYGTLDVNGTALNPVIFTSRQDDSAGGDTFGDGATVGAPNQWWGVFLEPGSSASTLDRLELRYAGAGGIAALELVTTSPSLSFVSVVACSNGAVDLNGTASAPSVSNCTFANNAGAAVRGVPIAAVPGFVNNAATGNGGNYIQVTHPSPTANVTIGPASCLGGALVFTTNCGVPAGVAMTLQAGVVLKFAGANYIDVYGTFEALGSAGNPVVLTTIADDAHGGDTNNDGASSGVPNSWWGVFLNGTSDASVLDHAILRYTGAGGSAALELSGSDATIAHTTIEYGSNGAIDLNATVCAPSISNCTFTGNAGPSVLQVRLDAVPGFVDNIATGNGGNYIQVSVPSPLASVEIGPENCLGGALVFTTNSNVPAGVTVKLRAGVVVKFAAPNYIDIQGTLETPGTQSSPVVFTTITDDAYGGDTNNDGPSGGTPNAWWGIFLPPTSGASVLDHTILRYCGAGSSAGLELSNSNATIRHTRVEFGSNGAIDLNNTLCSPTISDCTFTGNGGVALRQARIDSIPGFLNNTATGNGGNYIQVSTPSPNGNVEIGPENYLGGALVFQTNASVAPGTSLRLRAGVVIKFAGANYIDVNGTFDTLGTALEPVVITGFADDAYGGDTNNDGPSSGAPNAWWSVFYGFGSAPGRMEHTILRYTGAGGSAGLTCSSSNATLRSVRVEHGGNGGFAASALAGDAINWVARANAGSGIALSGDTIHVLHATVVNNGGVGIQSSGAHSGTIANSILRGNGGASFAGAGITSVHHSCTQTPTAGTGNISSDPLFVAAGSGDLHLSSGSPCIGTGDFATGFAVQKDWDETSRVLDSNLDGTVTADMGAYQYTLWKLAVSGTSKLGTSVGFTVTGPAGLSVHTFGLLDGTLYVPPYGFVMAGVFTFVNLGALPVGGTLTLNVPNDPALIGASYGYQAGALSFSAPLFGNVTNLYRATLHP
jgi:hypothetical protein